MLKIPKFTANCAKHRLLNILTFKYSLSSTSAVADNLQTSTYEQNAREEIPKISSTRGFDKNLKPQNSIVAAAFASINNSSINSDIWTPITDEKILTAASVDELLSISEGSGVSRRHALKVVSILADWTSSNKVKLADFETDVRFLRLCKILTKAAANKNNRLYLHSKNDDLSTILSITADDEAAKLVANITLPQMVKVMSTLSAKRRRSTLLLRALSFNITSCPGCLNLKQSADLLYSMATLNFVDDNLLSRIVNDVCVELENPVRKSAAIGSILTSLGLLRYNNPVILDALVKWVAENCALCRPQDIFSVFKTLAVLDYIPSFDQYFEILKPQLSSVEAGKPSVWLDIVWSLLLLKLASTQNISSVLNADFITNLQENGTISISSQLKLLNINAAALHLVKDYEGPLLPGETSLKNVVLPRTKEKNEMAGAVIDTLKNLIRFEKYVKTNVNTGFGFSVDAECCLDHNCSPLDLSTSPPSGSKLSIVALDYHDMTRGKIEPTGINVFARSVLESQGYNVLAIPYTEFKPKDKLINRVRYLESKLKQVVKS